MPKKAIIILAQGFEEIEAVTIIDILRRACIDLTVAGLDNLRISGSHGIILTGDKKLKFKEKLKFDACIFPGGLNAALSLAASEKVSSLIKRMDEEKKIIAAICASPVLVLAPCGILKNKSATCYPGMQKNFNKDTTYKEKNVVVDGNIITGSSPKAAFKFALTIVEKLCGKEAVKKIKNLL
ncbi:MAG: DJ-1/PfpI family protein [Candidatus Omnitrophota bacterium]|nr:DJ-1/PfpI family protein [Candidatus Omnitrophota bacterium]